MKRLIAPIALVVALTLGGCSSDVDVSDGPGKDGLCYQKQSKSFLGIGYSTSKHVINCG